MMDEKVIRIAPVDGAAGDCSGAEPFALVVLGDSMAPEFVEGDVIVVEPEGLATDGSFVVAQVDGEWTMRQLVEARWRLDAASAQPILSADGARRSVVDPRRRDPEEQTRTAPGVEALRRVAGLRTRRL